MAALYELTSQYRALADQLEEMDLDQETLIDTLAASAEMMSIEEKAEGIIRMTKNWEADVPAIDAEIKRLTDRKKAIENRVKSVKQYLQAQLEAAGIDKIKCGVFTISLQNKKASVEVLDQSQIPDIFIKTKIEQSVDKQGIYEAITKNGLEVPGAQLVKGRSLVIR